MIRRKPSRMAQQLSTRKKLAIMSMSRNLPHHTTLFLPHFICQPPKTPGYGVRKCPRNGYPLKQKTGPLSERQNTRTMSGKSQLTLPNGCGLLNRSTHRLML